MPDIVLDTCCLVNLYASRELGSILGMPGWRWHVPSAVEAEAIYTREIDDSGDWVLRQARLEGHFDAGTLNRCAVANAQETALYVELAAVLQDGEAMALAVARSRRWVLGTDDRKARREARRRGVRIATTPAILRLWGIGASVGRITMTGVLIQIRQGARFEPSSHFPGHTWWYGVTRGGMPPEP